MPVWAKPTDRSARQQPGAAALRLRRTTNGTLAPRVTYILIVLLLLGIRRAVVPLLKAGFNALTTLEKVLGGGRIVP